MDNELYFDVIIYYKNGTIGKIGSSPNVLKARFFKI